CEPLVPVPDDGALASARVYEDEGDLVARALYDLRARNVHALGAQGLEAETPGVVRAEAPRVCRAKPEPLQPRQRGGRLPACAALVRDEPRLRIELRVGGDDD